MGRTFEKICNIFFIFGIITVIVFIIIFIIAFKEMLNDHRCYTMPLNEFYQDKKCARYWDMQEWGSKNEK